MTRLFTFIGLIILLSATAANAQISRVPSPIAEGAAFSKNALVAEGPDGARVVVGGAAMITAASGSQILEYKHSDSGVLNVKLGDGSFSLHVGSKPVIFEIAGTTLEATGAVVTVSGGLVRVDRVFVDGRVEAKRIVKVAVQVAPPPEPATPPKKAKKRGKKAEEPPPPPPVQTFKEEVKIVPLEAGKTYRLTMGADPAPAAKNDEKIIEDVSKSLAEKPVQVSLRPAPIEDPGDLAGAAAKADEAMELAEIEAVEVEIEADCVEICTD